MSDIDTIRRAADILRDAAGCATQGAWGVGNGTRLATDVEQTSRGSFCSRYSIAEMEEDDRESGLAGDDEDNPAGPEDDAHYIALMQPSVGLAIAGWLQDEADGAQTLYGAPTAHAVAIATALVAVNGRLDAAERVATPA